MAPARPLIGITLCVAGRCAVLGKFLSFRTEHADDAELLEDLGAAVSKLGYAVDFDAGKNEPDRAFLARDRDGAFWLVLVSCIATPAVIRWFVSLEDEQWHTLEDQVIRQKVHPVLQAVVEGWPGSSEIRWHADTTTLGALSNA